MNPKIEELIAAVGATAEMAAQFYKSLLENDVDRQTALALTGELIRGLIRK